MPIMYGRPRSEAKKYGDRPGSLPTGFDDGSLLAGPQGRLCGIKVLLLWLGNTSLYPTTLAQAVRYADERSSLCTVTPVYI